MITEDICGQFHAVSEAIWSSMVNIPLTLSQSPNSALEPAKTLTSSVQVIGAWNGTVSLDMGAELARHATASLLGTVVEELTHDDVCDAAGELANMTAGGIKELLPQPCQISLPTVVMGTDFELIVPEGVVVYKAIFDTPHGQLAVTLVKGSKK